MRLRSRPSLIGATVFWSGPTSDPPGRVAESRRRRPFDARFAAGRPRDPTLGQRDAGRTRMSRSRCGRMCTPARCCKSSRGEIRLTYDTGVELRLLAPAEFVVGAAGGSLRRGGLRAVVPEKGRGFTIETPNGKVVDLGTEFGVAVDDFGVSEVSVFQGIVDMFPVLGGADAADDPAHPGRGRPMEQRHIRAAQGRPASVWRQTVDRANR